jgi:hypothetical protein
MAVISITTDVAGQIGGFVGGVVPRRVKIVSTDNLAAVSAAGYLNNVSRESGYNLYPTDVVDMWYSYISNANPGTYEVFTVSISNGVITLVPFVSSGNVLLPVVSGDFAIFNGTSGQIKDSSQAASSLSNPFVVTSPGTLTTNHIAQIADANGSIKDGGVLGTAASKASSSAAASVASVSGATVAGNFLKAADVAGTVTDGGAAIHAGVTATFAGGGVTNTFTTTNMLATSIVTAVILTSTNAVAIAKAVPGTNQLAVTFTADPGAGTTLNWISITPAI